MSSRVCRLLAFGCVLSSHSGCDSTGPAAVARVQLSPLAVSLVTGTSQQFSARLIDGSGAAVSDRIVTWSSTARNVASVSPLGLVTGVSVGSATIFASSGGKGASAQVTVIPPVASVTVSPDSVRTQPGASLQFFAIARDSAGNTLTGRIFTWSTSNSSAATVDGSTGVAIGVAEGTATIMATAEGKTGSAAMRVSVEPSGMTVLTERAFNCAPAGPGCEGDWYSSGASVIVQDPSAPKSPANVAQMTYPAGFTGGSGAGNEEIGWVGPAQKSTLYVSCWLRLDPNWQGHETGINKLLHFFINGLNRVVISAEGSGSNPLLPTWRLQGLAAPYFDGVSQTSTDVNLRPNVDATIRIIRGVWQRYEAVLIANTPGVADGSLQLWIDGAKVLNYAGIMFADAGGNSKWEDLMWSPTWGGTGDVVVNAMVMQMDHIYISGK